MVFVTISEKFVGRANHGRNRNDEKLEKTSAKPSHMANVKGPPSSQQKSSRVAITSISNRANVKGPLSGQKSRVATTTVSNGENIKGPLSSQQKSSRLATSTIFNRANVKGPLSSQQKSSRVATTTISNRENVKRPLSGQQKSSRMVTTTISKRNTHLHSSDVKRNARTILKPHVVPKPFRLQTDERSIVRALNAERSPKLVKVNAEKSSKLVKRTSIDPLKFISFETSGGESLIEEGVGDYEFIMGSAICYIFDGSHVSEACDGATTQQNPIPTDDSTQQMIVPNRIQFHQALVKMKNGWFQKFKCQAWMETLMHALTLPNIIQFQQELVKMKNGWFLKFKFKAWMETLMHALTLTNRIQFQQALLKMIKGWFLKLNLKCQSMDGDLDACTDTTQQNPISTGIGEGEKGLVSQAQSQMSSMDVDLDASTVDSEKKELVVELEKFLQMLSSNADYLQWKASLFPETPAISATSSNNEVTNSSGKSFSDNAKITIATKDDSVLKVGGTTPLEKDLDSMEARIDGSKMEKLLLSDCGDAKKRLITMPNDLAPIVESSLTSFEESQFDQHSSVKKKEYIPGLRNSNSAYVKPRMTGSLSRNGYFYSVERVPKSSKAAVGSLHKQSEKEYLLNGTKPALSYKELSNMTIIAKTSTRKFKLPAIPEDASVASFSHCTRNVPPPSTKSLANVGAKNLRAVFTQKHDRNIAACTRKIAKGAGLTEQSMTLTLPTIQIGSLFKKKHVASSVSMVVIPTATRIGANRKSDLRSKEMEKVAELEREFQTLRTESSMLSAQLTSLQRDGAKCNELKVRLQFMEQHVDLQHALNDDLRKLVDQLELLTSLITDPCMKGITQKSAVLSSEQCNVLSNVQRRRLATATANLLSAAAGK